MSPGSGLQPIRPAQPLQRLHLGSRVERVVDGVRIKVAGGGRLEDDEALRARELNEEIVVLIEMENRSGARSRLRADEELAALPRPEAAGLGWWGWWTVGG